MHFIKKAIRKILQFAKKVYVKFKKKDSYFDIRELFISQKKAEDFSRYDIAVRYLFIEQYFGKNDFGFSLYEKMQKKRMGANYNSNCINDFKKNIESYNLNGYNKNSKITIGSGLQLIDGSHRIALGLFFKHFTITATVVPIRTEYDYSLEWFIANDFSNQEIELIKSKYLELEKMCNLDFQCIMWPPMKDFFDDATNDLKKLANVVTYKDYNFDKFGFEHFIRGVYSVDDIEDWKVQKKIDNMSGPDKDNYTVRILEIKMDRPAFRLKQINNKTLSKRGEKIKFVIRTKYKDKIENYYYDNVMHIADNYYQNAHINSFKNINLDLTDYFANIVDYDYVMTKFDVPYMPKDFPKNIPYGKDIDILCNLQTLDELAKKTEEFCNCNFSDVDCIYRKISQTRTQIRLELNGFTIFIWDFSSKENGLNNDFITDAIKNSIDINGIKTTNNEYEFVFRKNILKNKYKSYHQEFVNNHITDNCSTLEERYMV